MRHVKLFLASGNSLKKDRDEVMLFLANKNQYLVKHGIYLDLIRWEFLSSSFSETRKQDEFNQLIEQTDIFLCLIYNRIGKYTEEEFMIAYDLYKRGKNPQKFYLYFKKIPRTHIDKFPAIQKFRNWIEQEEQIYRDYRNYDQLKNFINQNLDRDLPELLTQSIQEQSLHSFPSLNEDTVPEFIINNLEEADQLLNRKLTQKAFQIYSNSLKKVSRKKNPLLFGKIKVSLAVCYLNFSMFTEEENNLTQAICSLEEAINLFKDLGEKEKSVEASLFLAKAYLNMHDIRCSIPNINKGIQVLTPLNISESNLFVQIKMYELLGNLYSSLSMFENNRSNFEKADHFFQEGINICKKDTHNELLTNLLRGKATAYYRSSSDRKEVDSLLFLEKAVLFTRGALKMTNMETSPYAFASLKGLLGILELNIGRRKQDLKMLDKAIQDTTQQIELLNQKEPTADSLFGINNLAICYKTKFNLNQQKIDLEKAISIVTKALKVVSASKYPILFLYLNSNLGDSLFLDALHFIHPTDQKIDRIQQAVFTLEKGIIVANEDNYPGPYINIHFKIGNILKDGLYPLDKNIEHLQEALEHFQTALSIYAKKFDPDDFYNEIEHSITITRDLLDKL